MRSARGLRTCHHPGAVRFSGTESVKVCQGTDEPSTRIAGACARRGQEDLFAVFVGADVGSPAQCPVAETVGLLALVADRGVRVTGLRIDTVGVQDVVGIESVTGPTIDEGSSRSRGDADVSFGLWVEPVRRGGSIFRRDLAVAREMTDGDEQVVSRRNGGVTGPLNGERQSQVLRSAAPWGRHRRSPGWVFKGAVSVCLRNGHLSVGVVQTRVRLQSKWADWCPDWRRGDRRWSA